MLRTRRQTVPCPGGALPFLSVTPAGEDETGPLRHLGVSCVLSRVVKTWRIMFATFVSCSHFLYGNSSLVDLPARGRRRPCLTLHLLTASAHGPHAPPSLPLRGDRAHALSSFPACCLSDLSPLVTQCLTPSLRCPRRKPGASGPRSSQMLPGLVCSLHLHFWFQFPSFDRGLFLLTCFFSSECLFQRG